MELEENREFPAAPVTRVSQTGRVFKTYLFSCNEAEVLLATFSITLSAA